MEGKVSYTILEKAEAFALRIVKLYQHLQDKGERVMSKQVLRSGTSIGANITEGHYAASRADFINKYVIAEKEAAETRYWLTLLVKSGYIPNDTATQSIIADCTSLLKLLVASIKTAKENSSPSATLHLTP